MSDFFERLEETRRKLNGQGAAAERGGSDDHSDFFERLESTRRKLVPQTSVPAVSTQTASGAGAPVSVTVSAPAAGGQSGGTFGGRSGRPDNSSTGILEQLEQISGERERLKETDRSLNVDRGYLSNLGADWETRYANDPQVLENARGAQARIAELETNRAKLDAKERELKAQWEAQTGKSYEESRQEYGDNRSGFQKLLDSILDSVNYATEKPAEVGTKAVNSGLAQFTTSVANFGDMVLGRPLAAVGWKNNPLRVGADIMNDYNAYASQELMKAAGDNKAAQVGAQVLSTAIAAAPAAVMAFFTGGGSLAGTAGLETTAASQGMGTVQLLGQSLRQMMKDPGYWTSFIQEAGNNFYDARQWAKDDNMASVYAMTVGLINAGIEVGLDGASGIQGLERAVREGNTAGLKSFLRSAGEEGLEEIKQGLGSRGLGQLMGSGAPGFSTTDPDAVINPYTMAEEGAMGAAAAALMTGGQLAGRGAVNALNRALTGGSSVGGNVSAETSITAPEGNQGAQTEAEVVPTAETGTEGQKNNAPEGEGNIRLTEKDENEYAQTGNRQQIKAAKQETVASGEKIVLTNQEETRAYIHQAISGETKNVITKAFGRVGASMADDIYNKSNGAFDVEGWYLELVPSDLRHAYIQHSQAKQDGNIPLTEDDFLSVPDYIDNYDDIISCKTFKNGEREIVLGKKINGYSVIVEIVSKSRKSLAFKNMWGMDTAAYEAKYKNSTEYHPSRSSDVANDSTRTHNDAVLEGSVPQSAPSVNPEVSEKIQGTPDGNEKHSGSPVGSTGIDVSGDRGPESNISPQLAFVKGIIDDAIGAAKNGRADIAQVINRIGETATTEETARAAVEEYQNLFAGGEYATDAQGKVYKTGGETDLSLDERREDQYILGKRNINAFQFDHPQVHKFYVEAANMLLDDIGQTTRGERIFSWRPDQSAPVVSGVKRQTSGPIASLRDDYKMQYARIEDVLNRIINDKGQENIADAKRVETILDDILRNGYESMRGPVAPNTEYIETLRQMGQVGEEVTAGTETAAEPVDDALPLPQEPGDRNLSAAERGFADNAYNQWVENAETFRPEGENAARNASLPTRNLDGMKTSKVGQSVMEAANTSDERVIDIQNAYINGKLTIDSRVNSSLLQQALKQFNEDPDKALTDWTRDVEAGKVSNELVALGAVLLDSDKIKGNGELFMDVLTDYVKLGSSAGQALQAQRIYKALSPEGRLYMIKKVAQNMSDDVGEQLKISGVDAEAVLKAETDEDMDAALDRIYQHLADQIPATFKDKWTALRYMNMLGNFKTQIRNLAGNSLMTGMRAVKNDVASVIESVAARFNPDIERSQSLRVGKAWMDAAKADFENVKEAARGNGRYDDTSRTAIEQELQSRRRIFKTRPLEAYRKLTNWATDMGDEVFIKHHYARALAGYLKANGVSVEQFLENNVDLQLLNRATNYAIKEAQEATFHDNNAFSDWVSKLGRRQGTPTAVKIVAEGVAPFRKTPANVLVRAYEYSPLGLINTVSKAAKTGKGEATASDIINSAARVLTGSGIMALGLALRAGGFLRGTGDDDDEALDALMNRQDYSIVIPGKGSYTIDWLTPATMPLFMGANLWDIIDDEGLSLADIDSVLARFAEPVLETSMLSGVNDAIANVKFSENHLMQMAATYALNYAAQGVTNSALGQLERVLEPNRMTTYTSAENPLPDWLERILGQASAKIPGVDFQQTEYLDEMGHTESNGTLAERFWENVLSPGYYTPTHEGEKIYDGLQELHRQTGANPWPDTSAPKSFTAEGEKYTLDQEDKERYQKTQGSIFEDLAGQIFDAGKDAFTPEELLDIVSGIKSYAGSEAKREYFEENDIDAAVQSNFIAKAVTAGKEADIPYVVYMTYHGMMGNLDYEKGVSGAKKAAVVKVIDSLDLSPEQKDYLYLGEGYAENSINETPWH